MRSSRKYNRSYLAREQQYYARSRWLGFERKVDAAPDHRNSEEGLTADGLPAWHGDGRFLSRKEWQESGHGLRTRRRLHRPRTAERIITASSDNAIRRFVRQQNANRSGLHAARAAEPGFLRRFWGQIRRH